MLIVTLLPFRLDCCNKKWHGDCTILLDFHHGAWMKKDLTDEFDIWYLMDLIQGVRVI